MFPSLVMVPKPYTNSTLKKEQARGGKSGATSQNSLCKQTSSTAICIGTTFHLTAINQLQMGLLPGERERERERLQTEEIEDTVKQRMKNTYEIRKNIQNKQTH